MGMTMKKIILFIVCLLLLLAVALFFLDFKYNLRHFFDNWESEAEDSCLHIVNDYNSVYNKMGNRLFDLNGVSPEGTIKKAVCVQNDRIYFVYGTKDVNTKHGRIWHIALVNINGEDVKEHYFGNLSDSDSICPDLNDLSTISNKSEQYGVLYDSGQIVLIGNQKKVVFDIEKETIAEADEIPAGKYTWQIDNHQSVEIHSLESDIVKTITLEEMAQKNEYAKKLFSLSSRKNWNGRSPTQNFFESVKVIDEKIYLICTVYNWNGESFAIVFRYDFPSDSFYFLSEKSVGGNMESNYSFVPYTE